MYGNRGDEQGVPVTTMRVKSLMVPPGIPDWYSRLRLIERDPVELVGRAWSGGGVPIAKVEVAVAGQWREARLDPVPDRYAWRGWHCEWHATPREHELMCRATEADGETQPIEQRFDPRGLGHHTAHAAQGP